jgi:hypothetical protein
MTYRNRILVLLASLAGVASPAVASADAAPVVSQGIGPCVVSQAPNPGPVNVIVTQRGEVGVGCQTPGV